MFSKHPEPRSIASLLVLLFTLSATLLLFCGLGVFYWIVVRHALSEDQAVLADKLAALRIDLKERGAIQFADELTTRSAGEHSPYWIRVLASTSGEIAETPGMSNLLPANVFPPSAAATLADRGVKNYRTGTKSFSLVTMGEESNGQTYTIQVAQDRSSDEKVEGEFGILLLATLAGGIVASTVIAFTVTKRGLRPVREMTRSVENVKSTHLNARIAPTGWPRELQPLAVAFDAMLARLEDSFTRLSQFSADLAHELRTPIANILGEIQVTLRRDRSANEYREVLESAATECERLSGIVDNLLFVARADAEREPIESKKFDARAACEKIASFYRTVAEDRHVSIICAGDAEIHADPVLFERAISNLVDNALHFTPDGGEIKIDIAPRNGNTEVAVIDTGAGIGPEHLPRVFDRFYRVDSSRSSDGTGLGLALVKSIVDLHGGMAKIDSQLHHGTRVTLAFPQGTLPLGQPRQ
jgi:two-component system heavy metal sensor histidine kinase CusS